MMSPSSADPEVGTDSTPVAASEGSKECTSTTSSGSSKLGRAAPFSLLFLSMLSGLAVYSHSNRLGKVERKLEVNETTTGGLKKALTTTGDVADDSSKRRLDNESEDYKLSKRMVDLLKETFPECVNQRMNGVECKNFIDEEILMHATGDDRMTRTIISDKRSIMDVFYNTVVIYMDDSDHVVGRDLDGMIYYDFDWVSAGRQATPEEEAEIPPIIATETADGLYFENEPVLVEGSTVDDVVADIQNGGSVRSGGSGSNPIAGGVVMDPNTPDLEDEGCVPFEDRLNAALSDIHIPPAGERQLPAFDCTCLTGFHCCLLIKATVRDADMYNKSIQCHINYAEGFTKHGLFTEERGRVVNIHTNHNFIVSQVPHVEGSWPVTRLAGPSTGHESWN